MEIWTGVTDASLTDSQRKDSATQLLKSIRVELSQRNSATTVLDKYRRIACDYTCPNIGYNETTIVAMIQQISRADLYEASWHGRKDI